MHITFLIGNPGRKRSLGRQNRRQGDSTGVDLAYIGREDVDWIYLVQIKDQ
jgi:hypothetical protein